MNCQEQLLNEGMKSYINVNFQCISIVYIFVYRMSALGDI